MAFVNLPPNLQDMFYALSDRIMKLETGPNQAMYTAESAQGSAQSASAQSAQALAAANAASIQAASAQATAIFASAQAVSAQATANTAMLQATVASVQAVQAANLANAAQSTAVQAQSTANIANTNATIANTTANGKSTVTYSTSAPGTTANRVGDIWYQYGTVAPYVNKVIAQFSGNGGTSWTPVTVSGLVIANIDAGAITTGTLQAITISAGSGANSFNVSSTGVMTAQGVWVKGNITADTGTFNGQVNAGSGFFGNVATNNGWRIDATGITGAGGGYVAGGTIQGTNFNNGSGTFFVNSAGDLIANSASIQGTIKATSGFFGVSASNGWQISSSGLTGLGAASVINGGQIVGTSFNNGSGTFQVSAAGAITATSGTIGGFTLSSSSIFSGTNLVIESTGNISGGNSQTLFYGFVNIGGGAATGQRLIVAGTSALNGNTGILGNLTVTNSVTFGAITQQFEFLSSSGNVRVAQTYNTAVSGRTMLVSTAGLYGTSASTERKKHNIKPHTIDANALLQLEPVSFNYIRSIDEEQNPEYGFIAEDADRLGLYELVGYDKEGLPEYFAYEKLPVFLLQLIQELKAEIDQLKGAK